MDLNCSRIIQPESEEVRVRWREEKETEKRTIDDEEVLMTQISFLGDPYPKQKKVD